MNNLFHFLLSSLFLIFELVDGPDKFLRNAMRPGDRAADGDGPGSGSESLDNLFRPMKPAFSIDGQRC